MHANVLGTAVEYNLPVVWVVWNNYAYGSIRGLQRGYLGGRELATDFKHPDDRQALQPGLRAMARSAGVEGVSVDKRRAISTTRSKMAIAANKPFLIDANIGGDLNPGGAGVWELPGTGVSKPAIGGTVSAVAKFATTQPHTRHAWACPGQCRPRSDECRRPDMASSATPSFEARCARTAGDESEIQGVKAMPDHIPEEAKNFKLLGHDPSAAWGGGSIVEINKGYAYVGGGRLARASTGRRASPSTTCATRAIRRRSPR